MLCWDMNTKTWTYIRIRRHGSCRASWDTYGCWDMNPETWILQRILRYIWMLIYGSGDMDLAEEPEIQRCWDMSPKSGSCRGSILLDAETWIRRHGSCRESWDTHGCWDMDPETWILQRILRYKWMLRHECYDMNPKTWILQRILRFEDAETWIRRHGSCRGPWDIKMLRHESETWILQRILRYIRIWRHGSCRGSWDTKMLRHEC